MAFPQNNAMGWTTPFLPVGRSEYEDDAVATERFKAVHEYTRMMQLRSAEAKFARWEQEERFWRYEFEKLNRVINWQVLDAWQTKAPSGAAEAKSAAAKAAEAAAAAAAMDDAAALQAAEAAAEQAAELAAAQGDFSWDFREQSQEGAWLYAAALSLGEWCDEDEPVPPAVTILAREMEAAFHAPSFEYCFEGDDDKRAALVWAACETIEEERYEKVANEGLRARGAYDNVEGRRAFEQGCDWRFILQRARDLCFQWADRTAFQLEKDEWFDRYSQGLLLDALGTDEEPWFLKEDGRRPSKGPFDWLGKVVAPHPDDLLDTEGGNIPTWALDEKGIKVSLVPAPEPRHRLGALYKPDYGEVPAPSFDIEKDVAGLEDEREEDYEVTELLNGPTPNHKPFPTVAALLEDTSYADAIDSTVDWDQARFAEGQPLDPDAYERITGERPEWADLVKPIKEIVANELNCAEPGKLMGDGGGGSAQEAVDQAQLPLAKDSEGGELEDENALDMDDDARMVLQIAQEAQAQAQAELAAVGGGAPGQVRAGLQPVELPGTSVAPEALEVLVRAINGPPALQAVPSGEALAALVEETGMPKKALRAWFFAQFEHRRRKVKAAEFEAVQRAREEAVKNRGLSTVVAEEADEQAALIEAAEEARLMQVLPPEAVATLEAAVPALIERGVIKPTREEAEALAAQTGLSLREIQDWFFSSSGLRGR